MKEKCVNGTQMLIYARLHVLVQPYGMKDLFSLKLNAETTNLINV